MTPIEFRAPWSRSLKWNTWLAVATLVAVAIAGWLGARPGAVRTILMLLPAVLILGSLHFAVRGYAVTDKEILIRRFGGVVRYSLQGLRSVEGNAEAMRNAIRVFATGGVFAFVGWYFSPALKFFRAYVTDPKRAVVLRYRRKKIVISPHDPQQFIIRARTLLKLAEFPD